MQLKISVWFDSGHTEILVPANQINGYGTFAEMAFENALMATDGWFTLTDVNNKFYAFPIQRIQTITMTRIGDENAS